MPKKLKGTHPKITIESEHVLQDVNYGLVVVRQPVLHPVKSKVHCWLILLETCVDVIGFFEASDVVNAVLTGYEGKIAVVLFA